MNDASYLFFGLAVVEGFGIVTLGLLTFVFELIGIWTMIIVFVGLATLTLPGYLWAIQNGAFGD